MLATVSSADAATKTMKFKNGYYQLQKLKGNEYIFSSTEILRESKYLYGQMQANPALRDIYTIKRNIKIELSGGGLYGAKKYRMTKAKVTYKYKSNGKTKYTTRTHKSTWSKSGRAYINEIDVNVNKNWKPVKMKIYYGKR